MQRWYTRDWMDYAAVKDNELLPPKQSRAGFDSRTAYSITKSRLCTPLEAAVQRQLMTDVPYGVSCSQGGLDSSVISAIAKKYAAKRIETDNKADAWWPQLHSFAVG